MNVSVYSLKGVLFEGEASSLNCKTTQGEITVLDHHKPLVTQLKESVVKIASPGRKDAYIPITGGFLEVNAQNRVLCLIDHA